LFIQPTIESPPVCNAAANVVVRVVDDGAEGVVGPHADVSRTMAASNAPTRPERAKAALTD
jgi:hypothetical protein